MPIALSGFNKVHVNIVQPLLTTKETEFGDYRVFGLLVVVFLIKKCFFRFCRPELEPFYKGYFLTLLLIFSTDDS